MKTRTVAHSWFDVINSRFFVFPSDIYKLLVFKWLQAQVYFLQICMKYVVFMSRWPRTIKILIWNWPRTRKFSQLFEIQARKTFSYQGQALVSLCAQFYALIGQNLTGEFMQKIYAASWNLFTLTAEADRVFCQLVMFLTVFSTGRAK